MIVIFIVWIIVNILGWTFGMLPVATLDSLPIIGDTVSSSLLAIVIGFNSVFETLPYLEDTWNVFIYVVIPFEIAVLTAKLILGSRTPAQI